MAELSNKVGHNANDSSLEKMNQVPASAHIYRKETFAVHIRSSLEEKKMLCTIASTKLETKHVIAAHLDET